MGRGKSTKLKLSVTYSPVVDWDSRLKRVMALLLRSLSDESSSKAICEGSDSAGKEVPNDD